MQRIWPLTIVRMETVVDLFYGRPHITVSLTKRLIYFFMVNFSLLKALLLLSVLSFEYKIIYITAVWMLDVNIMRVYNNIISRLFYFYRISDDQKCLEHCSINSNLGIPINLLIQYVHHENPPIIYVVLLLFCRYLPTFTIYIVLYYECGTINVLVLQWYV